MKKIPTLFKRNYDGDRLVRDEVVEGCEWVLAGEGVATRKYDGTCCMVKNGKLYKRREIKRGKTPPPDFVPETDVDEQTGKIQGWVPVGDGKEDRWHREAFTDCVWDDGTYELLGPKIQGNPEALASHTLISHVGAEQLPRFPRTFDEIRVVFEAGVPYEGVVWHHPDGRMCKIKVRDFGFRRMTSR